MDQFVCKPVRRVILKEIILNCHPGGPTGVTPVSGDTTEGAITCSVTQPISEPISEPS